MLACVEDDERAGVPKPRDHPLVRIGAANVDGACQEPDGVRGAARRPREVDEPDALGELVLDRARRLEREPAFPDARRPDERDETVLAYERGDVGELLLPADERRRRCGEIAAAHAVDRDGGNRRIVREDRLLEPAEPGPRLESQLVGEHAPCLLERLQRIGLPAAAIERQHQLPPQPLPEGVVRERQPERRRELPMLAEREHDLEMLLERVHAQRLEPACLGAERRRPGQPLQRRAAPEVQRRRDRVRRGPDVAVPQHIARLREQLLELQRVHARVLHRVAVGRADDRSLSERGAKAGDVMVERVPRSGRQLLPPEAVDERVDADHTAVPQREHRQQRLTLRAAHVRGRTVHEHLERAEKPDVKRVVHSRLLPPRTSLARSRVCVKPRRTPRVAPRSVRGGCGAHPVVGRRVTGLLDAA